MKKVRLRALFQEMEEIVQASEDEARQAQDQRDGAVRERMETLDAMAQTSQRNTELKEELALQEEVVSTLVGFIDQLGAANKAIEDANYWLNKVRTDEDHDASMDQYERARQQLDAALSAALTFARFLRPRPVPDLVREPKQPNTMRTANGMGPSCNFGDCRACGRWHDSVFFLPIEWPIKKEKEADPRTEISENLQAIRGMAEALTDKLKEFTGD